MHGSYHKVNHDHRCHKVFEPPYYLFVCFLVYPLQDTSIVLTSSGYSGCIPFCKRKAIRVADIEMRVLHLESRVEDVPSREQVSELCTSAEDQDRRIRDLQVFASNTERDLQASISSTKAQFDGLQASVDIQIGGVIKTSKSVCESVGQCEQLSSSFKQEILSRLDNVEGCLTKLKEKVESQVQ